MTIDLEGIIMWGLIILVMVGFFSAIGLLCYNTIHTPSCLARIGEAYCARNHYMLGDGITEYSETFICVDPFTREAINSTYYFSHAEISGCVIGK